MHVYIRYSSGKASKIIIMKAAIIDPTALPPKLTEKWKGFVKPSYDPLD